MKHSLLASLATMALAPLNASRLYVDSSFDPGAFGSGSFEGEGDTRRFMLPAKEYRAFIVGPFNEDKKTRIRTTDKGYVIFEVVWQPEDSEIQNANGLEKLPTVRQSIFLDISENGGLDMGKFKNADLNKLRDAFGMNIAGLKWSFGDFIGKAGKIMVEQKPNKDDPANPYTNVTKVTK